MKAIQVLFFVGLLAGTFALYGANSKVTKLTVANFKEKVINSKEVWFVEFYAPWCGHCKSLAPEFEKLANAVDGIIRVGAVDMTTDQQAGAPYNVQGFPTLKVFGADKSKPTDYQGGRTANEMMNFAFQQAQNVAKARMSGKKAGGSGGSSQGSQGGNNNAGGGSGSDKDVIVLDDSNFDEILMASEDIWLVEFYAPWCGHCKRLEPEWNSAATKLKGEVKVAKVDATVATQLASRFGIQGFPTIKLFPSGAKSDSTAEVFDGGRDSGSIVSYALQKKDQYKPIPKVEQLVNPTVFDETCGKIRGVCFIAFLPHIYDASAAERDSQIEIFTELAKSHRTSPVAFLWAQGGDHYEMEEAFTLGSGYPALVAVSVNKGKFAPFRGAFTKRGIDLFIKGIMAGKESLFNLHPSTIGKVKKVKEWDGRDAAPPSESDL